MKQYNEVLFHKLERKIGQLENRVRERTIQLEIANREMEAFAYSVSHDLRAPLRAIDGFSAILSGEYSGALDSEAKRLCSVIRENTQRMAQLIDDLLAFSRAGRATMGKTAIDMSMIVRTAFMDLVTPEASARIDFLILDLPQAMGDLPMFRQAWMNLLSNAIKFSSKKERAVIKVSAEETESGIVYSVEDNGAGFDMRYYDRLFGVFERLHAATEFPGTGVGLAIVKRIISRHGGRVWAASDIGKGATFFFSIPRESRKNTDTNNGGNHE